MGEMQIGADVRISKKIIFFYNGPDRDWNTKHTFFGIKL